MEKLSNELLREILDHIEADPEKSVSIDRRAYLSVESFKAPSPPIRAQAQDIAHFRLVCRRFAELGIPHQFTRVTTRFSSRGFARLERIADWPHVAAHVKKFSYMVPCFYTDGRDRVEELFRRFPGDFQSMDTRHFVLKANEQRELVRTRSDLNALTRAIFAFKSLQHVQILRLQDEADRVLLEHLRENDELANQLVELRWTPACAHGTRTLGQALLESQSPFTRFSGPMMNPQSAVLLDDGRISRTTIPSLASRLTCLELHFDEGTELDGRIQALSGLFRDVFMAATGMQAVHIGFPSRSPLNLGLEQVFHGVKWEKLRAFGIQAWRLDADEIIALARRHRKTLRGIRLRDVLLRQSSMWKTVLGMLREEMELLDWVSLRRIGYERSFDEMFAGTMEIPPDPPGVASDSDEEDSFPTHISNGEDDDEDEDHSDDSDDDSVDSTNEDDDDNGPEANALALDPDTPSSLPWCSCGRGSYPETSDELGDNGQMVDYVQRKLWEKWVVGRCPEHSRGWE
ncbi:MAG: hypothetical protein M4579_000143 [Chaenotheca gracillima]|nr:MAG: hypothetical protein M4579_000143 [Chaenotheca gracillima]